MRLTNKRYDMLKNIAIVVIPAVATFVGTVGVAIGWAHTDLTITIMTAFATMLGTVLGVSSKQYNKGDDDSDEDY